MGSDESIDDLLEQSGRKMAEDADTLRMLVAKVKELEDQMLVARVHELEARVARLEAEGRSS